MSQIRSGKIGFFLNTWNWLFFWPPNLGLLGFSPFFFAAQQTVSNIAYMDSILTVEHCPNELIIAAKEYHWNRIPMAHARKKKNQRKKKESVIPTEVLFPRTGMEPK